MRIALLEARSPSLAAETPGIEKEIIVMRSGRVVEQGGAEQIFCAPQDDYTRSLIKAAMDFEVWNGETLEQ